MKSFFPYPFREKQEELLEFIQKEVWNGAVCIDAPTGFGKTPVILASLLPFVEERGVRIIWAVRTGTETDRPIEELKVINRKGGKFFGLSYRGKKDMCLLAREMKQEMDHEEVSFLCKTKGEECKYRRNFYSFEPKDLTEEPLLFSEILAVCRKRKICPYLAQRELLPYADVISLSYNYIIDAGLAWSIKQQVPFKRSFLVVDEAHNLQHACSNLFSDSVTSATVKRAMKEAEELSAKRVVSLISKIQGGLGKIKVGEEEREFDIENFLNSLSEGESEILEDEFLAMRDYGNRVRRKRLEEGKRPQSSLFHLASFFLASLENLGVRGVKFLCRRENDSLVIERWDMRASEVLAERWPEFLGCIFCSGTLSPIDAFAETVGLKFYSSKKVPSNFPPQNVLALITRELTTRGETLSPEMAKKYVEAIKKFAETLRTNVAVFCASYRILDDLVKAGLREEVEGLGMRFFRETQGMSGETGRRMLEEFKKCAGTDEPGLLCASAGGRFAEGADFPGRELEGIFLVGVPFERMTVRTKLYIQYYRELYGRKGRYYAYVVPALRRASQALGRALRSKEDKAALVCGDERFARRRFLRLLPDYFRRNAKLVNPTDIKEELSSWARVLGG
jgi:DNA excision repair protein ERCC-2